MRLSILDHGHRRRTKLFLTLTARHVAGGQP